MDQEVYKWGRSSWFWTHGHWWYLGSVGRAKWKLLFVKQFSLSGFLGRKETNVGSCTEGFFE